MPFSMSRLRPLSLEDSDIKAPVCRLCGAGMACIPRHIGNWTFGKRHLASKDFLALLSYGNLVEKGYCPIICYRG